jgi:hypothetical protein
VKEENKLELGLSLAINLLEQVSDGNSIFCVILGWHNIQVRKYNKVVGSPILRKISIYI